MCLRISSALILFAATGLAGCGGEGGSAPSPNALASASPSGAVMTCAIGAGAALSPGCFVEKVASSNEIIVYHPDGGFRRLTRDPANGTLATRDGAEPLVLETSPQDVVQFTIGADRYRIPLALLTGTS
jgi:hypothetical protein